MRSNVRNDRSTSGAIVAAALCLAVVATVAAQGSVWPYVLLYQKDGPAVGDWLGCSVAGAGDVNGDEIADFIVGANGARRSGHSLAGAAYVYSGLDGAVLYEKEGAAASDYFGSSVAGAGDVNGDGRADYIIGSPSYTGAGTAYIYSGLNGSVLNQMSGTVSGDRFGASVAGVGDVNGDGRADFIIGAYGANPGGRADAGSVYVYSGLDYSLLYQKDGTAAGDELGLSVAGAGDVNGDGRADFIIGADAANPSGRTDAGSAYVYSGLDGSLLYQKDGVAISDLLGRSVAGAGDVNGDGRADFIIGAPYANPDGRADAGSAYVYSGLDGSLLYQRNGAATGDKFGWSVAGAGDVTGDGRIDFMIGAAYADPGGRADAGVAYVYSGVDGSLTYQRDGVAAGDVLGWSVAVAGDMIGQGRVAFIIGAFWADPGGRNEAGSAYVIQPGYVERIEHIADVGNDQGRQVRIQWKSLPGDDNFVKNFAIYRRVGAFFSGAKSIDPFGSMDMPPGNWDFTLSVPAGGDTLYNAIVPTVADSTAADGIYWSVFFIRALSDNPTDHFDSPPDSGYSKDNLDPAPPTELIAAAVGSDVTLDWRAIGDADFDYYWIYRDVVPDFVPIPGKRLGTTSDTTYGDTPPSGAPVYYYKVAAVDFAGNEGSPSNEATAMLCSCPCKYDPRCDGVISDVLDVSDTINRAFRGYVAVQDPGCPVERTDVDASTATDVLDVTKVINVAFRGQPIASNYVDPCAP